MQTLKTVSYSIKTARSTIVRLLLLFPAQAPPLPQPLILPCRLPRSGRLKTTIRSSSLRLARFPKEKTSGRRLIAALTSLYRHGATELPHSNGESMCLLISSDTSAYAALFCSDTSMIQCSATAVSLVTVKVMSSPAYRSWLVALQRLQFLVRLGQLCRLPSLIYCPQQLIPQTPSPVLPLRLPPAHPLKLAHWEQSSTYLCHLAAMHLPEPLTLLFGTDYCYAHVYHTIRLIVTR